MTGYRLDQRNRSIRAGRELTAPTAGANLGEIQPDLKSSQKGDPGNLSRRPAVIYRWGSPVFTRDGKLSGTIIRPSVSSASCLQCHGDDQAFHTATLHGAEYDVHVRAGLRCTDCHGLAVNVPGGRLAHRIGRGSSGQSVEKTGMKTCRLSSTPSYRPDSDRRRSSAFHAAKFRRPLPFRLLSLVAATDGEAGQSAYFMIATTSQVSLVHVKGQTQPGAFRGGGKPCRLNAIRA